MIRCSTTSVRALAGALFVASLSSALPAGAAQPTTSDAEGLIKRANALRGAKRDQEALPLYQKAYEIAPTPRTAAQLGLCETILGYWLSADTHLSEALAGKSEWIDRNRATLEQTLRMAQKQIGQVSVTGTPAGAIVSIGGKQIGTVPMAPLRVAAGQLAIEVSAPGYKDHRETVTVAGESHQTLAVNLLREGAAVEPGAQEGVPAGGLAQKERPAGADSSSSWGAGKIAGVVLIGVGVAAIATGAFSLRGAAERCGAPTWAVCNQGDRSTAPGWALIGVGAAAAIAGGVTFAVSGGDEEPARHAFVLSLRGAF
jgi:hypothetical protein